jgi:Tfp pilus assembly protein FimV
MGFAVAASVAVIAFTIVNSPSEIIEPAAPVQIAYEEPAPIIEEVNEEPEPMFVSGSEMETLWSTASQIANDLGVDRYQVMYALYEANKDFFVNNDINAPRADRDYFVDLAIIETVDVSFAANEVKRHIFCHC